MEFKLWHAFVIGAVLSWGVYVPVLHEGQTKMGGDPRTTSMRGFLCVGIAYFLTAVVVPVIYMLARGDKFEFSAYGSTFAILGGVFGAAGALCIILAIGSGGSPLYIAPLVFAGAPIINSIVGLVWKTQEIPDWRYFVGIILAALGAFLVLYSKSDLDRQKAQHARARAAAAAVASLEPSTGAASAGIQEAPR
jgi:drug/metabolite transporter (DMT)-like permease